MQHALNQLGVSREEVKVTVLREGKHGVFRLGSEEAVIRVEVIEKAAEKAAPTDEKGKVTQAARDVVATLLKHMGVTASVSPRITPEEEALLVLDINGEDLGILIGRRGQTLSCLQYITRLILAHRTESLVPVTLDVEGYKERRYAALRSLAQRMGEQVRNRRLAFTLEPMPADERRVIHLTLAEYPDITTESVGEGEGRKVMILLKDRGH
jgi:spoIIIJ-associated protein